METKNLNLFYQSFQALFNVEQEVKIFIPEEAILEVIVSPFRDQSGALNGVVAVMHDARYYSLKETGKNPH